MPRSPPSVREFLREDRLRDVLTSHHASGPAGDPCVGGEEEPDHFSKPNTQQDSGSEHSFRSQKSFDKVSFGKTFQSGHPKSNSNSPRSSGSHRYSYAHSHSLHSNGSHGGLSVRSSVSDIISDKADWGVSEVEQEGGGEASVSRWVGVRGESPGGEFRQWVFLTHSFCYLFMM